MGETCAICGEPLDDASEPRTIRGEAVCDDAAECLRRWIAQSRELRDRARHTGTSAGTERRGLVA